MKAYSTLEEIINSVIHGIGVILAIVGTTALCVQASYFGSTSHMVSYLVYGLSLVLLYTSSTLYHALTSERAKKFFKVCDHSSIYLLIAGTYTPFLVLNLKDSVGYQLMYLIWGIALVGVIFKLFFTGKFKYLSTILYLGMGWIIIFALEPLKAAIHPLGVTWLLIGGITYTAGTVFYIAKSTRFTHAIWHFFVLLGSIFHYIAIVYARDFISH